MPQAVEEYSKTRDFDKVDTIKRDILNLYRNDVTKHADGYEIKIRSIFDEIPSQLQKHEKKFKLSSIKKNARFRDYEDAIFWLDDAMIVNNCYNSTEPNIGLKLNMERTTLKCYMADTGLLISHAFDENGIVSEEIYKKLLFDKLEVNKGMLVENIVAQMLISAGHKLYFYSNTTQTDSNSRMEIDFLISKSKVTSKHNISPIEVKSGKNYTLNSLNKFMIKYKEQTATPYVIHTSDYKEENGITYLPIYMTMLL
jgi:predicted AAA+ superfamily ATPase